MSDSLSAVLAARELLSTLTPLKTDCGALCSHACCAGDETTGMLLFPGEETLYDGCTFGKVLGADFTLGGQFLKNGGTKVRMDDRARAVCPLCDYGMTGLDEEFVAAARQAYDILLEDETCRAYLRDLYRAFKL